MTTAPFPPNLNGEIEQAFEARYKKLHSCSEDLCPWCGYGFKGLLYDEWRRIGMGCGWDPRKDRRHADYARLYDNLITGHCAACKPYTAYDSNYADPDTKQVVSETPQQAKEVVMWQRFGLWPEEFGELRIVAESQ